MPLTMTGGPPLQLAGQRNHHNVAILLRDAQQKLPQTARLDTILPDFNQPGSSKLPAAQPGASNKTSEVSAQPALPVDTVEPAATYTAPPLSCLRQAAKEGNIECVKALLCAPGIRVSEKDNDGLSPLCHAARYGHAECINLLLSVPGIR